MIAKEEAYLRLAWMEKLNEGISLTLTGQDMQGLLPTLTAARA